MNDVVHINMAVAAALRSVRDFVGQCEECSFLQAMERCPDSSEPKKTCSEVLAALETCQYTSPYSWRRLDDVCCIRHANAKERGACSTLFVAGCILCCADISFDCHNRQYLPVVCIASCDAALRMRSPIRIALRRYYCDVMASKSWCHVDVAWFAVSVLLLSVSDAQIDIGMACCAVHEALRASGGEHLVDRTGLLQSDRERLRELFMQASRSHQRHRRDILVLWGLLAGSEAGDL